MTFPKHLLAAALTALLACSVHAQTLVSIKQFNKMSEKDTTTVMLRGVVTRVRNAQNGNLYIKDKTGTVLIYGVRDGSGQGRKFPDLDVRLGDTLTLRGRKTIYDGNVVEMVSGKLVAKGNGPDHDKMARGTERVVVAPKFKGKDIDAFRDWVGKHVAGKEDASGNKLEGIVEIKFVVGSKGGVQEVEIAKGAHPLLNEEAVRVVKSSPKWKPGTVNGRPTRTTYSIPVQFGHPVVLPPPPPSPDNNVSRSAPKGKLIYCSYSETRVAGRGKDYCELVADEGKKPVIHVRLNVGNDMMPEGSDRQGDFTVDAATVESLRKQLADGMVHKLNGYEVEEGLCGGTIYRIYMEYDSGEKINARWHGHEIKDEAWAAYYLIRRFFAPWREKVNVD